MVPGGKGDWPSSTIFLMRRSEGFDGSMQAALSYEKGEKMMRKLTGAARKRLRADFTIRLYIFSQPFVHNPDTPRTVSRGDLHTYVNTL